MPDSALHSNPYLHDLFDQPAVLGDTLQALGRTDFAAFYPLAEQLASGALRRVVLTGMGSSYHALHPLCLTLIARGLAAQMIETSELIHYAPGLLAPDTLVVAVSQSGRSVEIVQLLEHLAGRGPLVGVTNTPGSPLAGQARALLLTRAGTEHTVSCKTYVTALAALNVLGELLTGRGPQSMLAELQAAPEPMARYLASWETHVGMARSRLAGARCLFLAGRGPSLAAVGTGSLILKEAAHFPAEGMSSAAFRHGPFEMALPDVFVLVYAGDGRAASLNLNLVEAIRRAGGRSALVTRAVEPDVFSLPPVPDAGLPLLEILPAQMLSIALALEQGRSPGQFERAAKITQTE